jgi:two-component system, chemotaxis family, protein-glutamate methylesterase/glutaminase
MQTEAMVQVLVVEDSMTARRFLVDLINQTPGLMVCGEAYDGVEAVRLTAELFPNVISMDIQMPRMNGVEATQHIMHKFPTPIVVAANGIGQHEVDVTMQALAAGAVAAIPKPSAAPQDSKHRTDYVRMLRYMSRVSLVRRYAPNTEPPLPQLEDVQNATVEVVVIGASTGGPGALVRVLGSLPADFPVPILVVQHLEAPFVPGFVDWLDRHCEITVRLAEAGEIPGAGEVLVAPGNTHMALQSDGQIVLNSNKGEHRHQPAVDVLFDSAVSLCGQHAVGVLLSGMGDDGARGMEKLYTIGAQTIVQDEATSVVFGMPGAAIDRNAVTTILPDTHIGPALLKLCRYAR